ncbi:MAG: zinc-dependent metalloprotease, partial [Acidimicrobiia bacterium]|nr:zinc-dependent metalloprotease [Acidimicrobiia bacterium]
SELIELARIAGDYVANETGVTEVLSAPVKVIGAPEWARMHLGSLRLLLETFATTLSGSLEAAQESDSEHGLAFDPTLLPPELAGPLSALGLNMGGADPFGGIMKMIAPILLGTQAGSMIGSLARNALGRYDLPLPTSDAPGPTFVLANLLEFESEWSIEPQDLRLYIALHEAVHTSIRCRPWVQSALARIANEYVSGFDIDVARLEEQFGGLDPTNPESIAAAAEQPDAILGAMRSPRQEPAARSLRCFVIAMVGYGDCILEHLGRPLLPEFGKIHEAVRRHRVDQGDSGRFVENLLGIRLDRDAVLLGQSFCSGIVERVGYSGLHRLWESESMLPTPSELEAPGLWLARIELPETPSN